MDFSQYLEVNHLIMMGKPVVNGTRVTVEQILEELSVSDSFNQIIETHPHLNLDQIQKFRTIKFTYR